MFKDYLVVDTEGNPLLKEIAVINSLGNLIFEAIVTNNDQPLKPSTKGQSLVEVLNKFLEVIQEKFLVFHYAEHDLKILYHSFKVAGITSPKLQTYCTYKLSLLFYPQIPSHSLENLCKFLHLKVADKRFNPALAHRAKYDALFTHQLYQNLMQQSTKTKLKSKTDPFVNNRVDTPFQQHPDQREVFESEFNDLKIVVEEISQDPNHQSRGVVVIGEPGSGKTHLMMRLAKDILETNRLLYIRQPNNAQAVIFHTYSRILESLIEPVQSSSHNQLEYLIAHSFAQIMENLQSNSTVLTQRDKKVLEVMQKNPLKLFSNLAKAETQTKRNYWEHIEKRALNWWDENYSPAGYAPQIFKGILRFCRYSDPSRRRIVTQWLAMNDLPAEELEKVQLFPWSEEMSREEVSLEAIKVLGCLSLLEKPLLLIFDQLEGLGQEHNERLLWSFGESIKEILTHVPNSLVILNLFPHRWQQFKQVFDGSVVHRISQSEIVLKKPPISALKKLLNLRAEMVGFAIEELFANSEIDKIVRANSIRGVLSTASNFYREKVYNIPLAKKYDFDSRSTTPNLASFTIPWQELNERLGRMEKLMFKIAEKLDIEVDNFTEEAVVISDRSEYLAEDEVVLDEPILVSPRDIIQEYFDRQKVKLKAKFMEHQILTDLDDVGKLEMILRFFKDSWDNLEIEVLNLGKRVTPEHLAIKIEQHQFVIAFLHEGGSKFFYRIRNYNELMIYHPSLQFKLCRDETDYPIKGTKSRQQLDNFKSSPRGDLIILSSEQRILFELIYQTIVDLQNLDLEVSVDEFIKFISSEYCDFWLWKILPI
ncbi:MAG: exonuclease [Cyanobacteriota bacterium]|nr:exonuclease [Cyanobacteriota bacterium]